ncbi:MAG: (d)CMP kinase [Candidatus Nanohalobium sp.]
MESYIEELRNSNEKEAEFIITVSGPSGSGKSTLAQYLAEKLEFEHISAGKIFRSIASERDETVEELSHNADKETDLEVDQRVLKKSLKKSCVVDSRIAPWVLGRYSDFNFYLTAEEEERARRVAERKDITEEEALKRNRKRDRDNRSRYSEYYGISPADHSIFDAEIDTTDQTPEEQNKQGETILRKRFPQLFE